MLELRARTGSARAIAFESRCDTEVVLHAFLEWDVEAFARLRGMFAAAFWTESRRRLVLVRDRMGIKPLYYRAPRRRSVLRLGAEGDSAASGNRAAHRYRAALDRYLSLNYVPGPHTLVEGIEKLAARALAGMARRRGVDAALLAARVSSRFADGSGIGEGRNWTGCCAAPSAST